MDINGGQFPNANGSPIWPGTQLTGPLLAGNVYHTSGNTLAGLGEYSGLANAGYANMCQTAGGIAFSAAATQTTPIVIPAQSQITDIYAMVTTIQAGATVGIGTTAGGTSALTALTAGSLAALGQLNITLLPTTAPQIALWDNTGNTDIQVTATASATGAGVITLTVFYVQGINNVS